LAPRLALSEIYHPYIFINPALTQRLLKTSTKKSRGRIPWADRVNALNDSEIAYWLIRAVLQKPTASCAIREKSGRPFVAFPPEMPLPDWSKAEIHIWC
jgi:hypothetical protein